MLDFSLVSLVPVYEFRSRLLRISVSYFYLLADVYKLLALCMSLLRIEKKLKNLLKNSGIDAEISERIMKSEILIQAKSACVDVDNPAKPRAKLLKQTWKFARMELKRDVMMREKYLDTPVSIIPCRDV